MTRQEAIRYQVMALNDYYSKHDQVIMIGDRPHLLMTRATVQGKNKKFIEPLYTDREVQ